MGSEALFIDRSFPVIETELSGVRRTQADATGYAAGYAAGMRAAGRELEARRASLDSEAATARAAEAARVASALAILTEAASATARCVVPVLADAHAVLAETGIALAEAILAREVPDAAAAATVAIERIDSTTDITDVVAVRMNPVDIRELEGNGALPSGVPTIADGTLAPGDVIAEFSDGYLEAGIRSALARARAALTFGTSLS